MKRQRSTPAPSSLYFIHLPHEKRRLKARIANLERQNKERKAKLLELETTQDQDICDHCHIGKQKQQFEC